MSAKAIKKGQDEYAKKGYLTAQDGRTTTEQLVSLRDAADDSLYYLDVVAYPDITLGIKGINEGNYPPSHTYKINLELEVFKTYLRWITPRENCLAY